MKDAIKISIVTVSYNAVDTIEQTIRSVIEQNYSNIEYIIIDGCSTDGTQEVIKKYEDKLSYWVSEPDGGMYDALVKGFNKVTGDICAYINADDFYQPGAFSTVASIFTNHNEVNWITGISTVYNMNGNIISAETPYKYRRKLIRKGGYNGIWLPFIQQESTFWRTDLLNLVDFERLKGCRLAGDYYLWYCFSERAELDVVMIVLSGFRKRKGQLSSNLKGYLKELNTLCKQHLWVADYIVALHDRIAGRLPKWTNDRLFIYNTEEDVWERNMSIIQRVRYYIGLIK